MILDIWIAAAKNNVIYIGLDLLKGFLAFGRPFKLLLRSSNLSFTIGYNR